MKNNEDIYLQSGKLNLNYLDSTHRKKMSVKRDSEKVEYERPYLDDSIKNLLETMSEYVREENLSLSKEKENISTQEQTLREHIEKKKAIKLVDISSSKTAPQSEQKQESRNKEEIEAIELKNKVKKSKASRNKEKKDIEFENKIEKSKISENEDIEFENKMEKSKASKNKEKEDIELKNKVEKLKVSKNKEKENIKFENKVTKSKTSKNKEKEDTEVENKKVPFVLFGREILQNVVNDKGELIARVGDLINEELLNIAINSDCIIQLLLKTYPT